MTGHDGRAINVGHVHVLNEDRSSCRSDCPHPDHHHVAGDGALFDGSAFDTVPAPETTPAARAAAHVPDPVASGLRQSCAFLGGARGQTKVRETGTWLLLTGGTPPLAHLVYRRQGDGAKAACGRIGGVLDTPAGMMLPTCPKCLATT